MDLDHNQPYASRHANVNNTSQAQPQPLDATNIDFQWDNSAIPPASYQSFSNHWQQPESYLNPQNQLYNTNSDHFYGSFSQTTPTHPTQNAFLPNTHTPDSILASQSQMPPAFSNYNQPTISPDVLQNTQNPVPVHQNSSTASSKAQSSQATNHREASSNTKEWPPHPPFSVLTSGLGLSSRAPALVYKDPGSIGVPTVQFKRAAFAVFEKIPKRLNISDGYIPEYTPGLSLNEKARLQQLGEPIPPKPKKSIAKKAKVDRNKNARAPRISRASSEPEPVDMDTTSDAATDTSTMDDASDDDMPEPEEVSPISGKLRPADQYEAVKYDTIKALWLPSRRSATPDEIRAAIRSYYELHKELHDRWRPQASAYKDAKAKKADNLSTLKLDVTKSVKMFEVAVTTALEFGHKDFLECLADAPQIPAILISWLMSRTSDEDINSSLTARILELLCRCTTLTTNTLSRLKFEKIEPKFAKRGNEHTKGLVKKLLSSTAAATKRLAMKENEPKKDQNITADVPIASEPISGAKRPREADNEAQPEPKRQISSANAAPSTLSSATVKASGFTKRPTLAASESKNSSNAVSSTTGATSAPVPSIKKTTTDSASSSGSKVTNAQNRKSSFFKDLRSTPNTTQTGQRAGSSHDKSAPTASMGEAKPSNVFNFSNAIANLTRKPDTAAAVETGPPETAEEKRIRLKKEARRKLTKDGVRFKVGDALVEIREFYSEPVEDDRREDNLVRDARNAHEEGRMFKQHMEKDVMDEDDDGSGLVTLRLWVQPRSIDFDTLAALPNFGGDGSTRDANYIGRGGLKEPDSAEQKVQEARESKTLMVVYTSRAEIPPSPRETSSVFSGETVAEYEFGQPTELTLQRVRTIQPAPDISSLLNAISGGHVQQFQTPAASSPSVPNGPQAPAMQTPAQDFSVLEQVFAQYSVQGEKTAAPPPQVPQRQLAAQQPFAGLGVTPDIQAILAALPRQNSSAASFQDPSPAQVNPQIQAILAQLGQGGSAQGSGSQGQGYGVMDFQMQQPQQQAQRPGQGSSYQTERDDYYSRNSRDSSNRRGSGNEDSNDDRRERRNDHGYGGYGESSRGNRSEGGANGDRKKQKKFLKVPCKYFQIGKCNKGQDCQFKHS